MNATTRATASSSPSRTASTLPSPRFATHPVTPARTAARRVESRKKTPCTWPCATTRRRITRHIVTVVELRDILRRRRMIRAYRPEPVPHDVLERVVATVRRAPSAGFSQGQRLVVVTDGRPQTRACRGRRRGALHEGRFRAVDQR